MQQGEEQNHVLTRLMARLKVLQDRIDAVKHDEILADSHEKRFLLKQNLEVLEAQRDALYAEIEAAKIASASPAQHAVARSSRDFVLERGQAATNQINRVKKRWALLIGVDHYDDPLIPDLHYCYNDVVAMEDILSKVGYTTTVLHSKAVDNLRPTFGNMLTQIQFAAQKAGPDDLLLVYFAGHGKLIDGAPVLAPQDIYLGHLAKYGLQLSTIRKEIQQSEASRLVLVLDACHLGVQIGREVPDPNFILNVYDLAHGLAIIAASTAQQVAQESHTLRHGVFTSYLVQGLAGHADREHKQFVTVDDLKKYTLSGLRAWRRETGGFIQEPTAASEVMGDMILADYREEPFASLYQNPEVAPAQQHDSRADQPLSRTLPVQEALIVGCDALPLMHNLYPACRRSAEQIADVCQVRGGNTQMLVGEETTSHMIATAFEMLAASQTHITSFIFWSGAVFAGKPPYVLYCYDTTVERHPIIALDQLIGWLRALQSHDRNLFLCLDIRDMPYRQVQQSIGSRCALITWRKGLILDQEELAQFLSRAISQLGHHGSISATQLCHKVGEISGPHASKLHILPPKVDFSIF